MNNQTENNVPLLPFGEPLRLLLLGSSLNPSDLKFMLNRRGIYIKDGRKESTIPTLANILLSPREFDILKNKQQFRESTIKVSDALTAWDTDSDKTIQQALPDEIEPFIRNLITENSSYQLTDCGLQINDADEVTINFSIKKQDWTRDVFSSTSVHDGKLTISKDENKVVTYKAESTAPETKELLSKLQSATHSFFQEQGAIAKDSTVQKVIANYFESNSYIFEFLRDFISQRYDTLTFERISDIDVGINQKFNNFPPNFMWLKGNIDKITLHGSRIDSTDVMKLGELGILVFGEIEADFKFDYPEAKGTCTIKYGFPNFDEKKGNVEFEAKIARMTLFSAFLHVSKEKVSKNVIQDFQKNKHQVFEQFVIDKKANSQKRNLENQFEFDGYGW
jgi:hypothetical protein